MNKAEILANHQSGGQKAASDFDGMKILQVSTVAATVRVFIAPFARHFQSLGAVVDTAANGVESDADCQSVYNNCFDIPFSRSLLSKDNLLNARWRLKQIVAEGQYDIVHVHTPIAAFVTRHALRKSRKHLRVIYTAHGFHFMDGDESLKSRVFKMAERIAAKWTDHLIVINQMDYDNALRYGLGSPETVSLLPGIGIDLKEFSQANLELSASSDIKTELGLPDTAKLFLMMAEYTTNKRHCDAIEALAKTENENFHLVLAGPQIRHPKLTQLAVESGVADRVHILGFRKDCPELLQASDALLLVSDREGLPRSIMEALAMGKTVIGTKIRGTSDLLKDNVGLLVPRRSPDDLAKAMHRSLDFESNQDARRKVLEACEISGILAAHEKIYQQVSPPAANPIVRQES